MKLEAILWMLILASLALAIVSPKYRKYGLVVLGIAVVTVIAVILLVSKNETLPSDLPSIQVRQATHVDFEKSHVDKLDREEPEAKDRIKVSEIRFDHIRPSGGSEPGGIDSISARLYNDSARFTLTDYAYYLVVQDCVDQVCTTIYDQQGLESTMVPAAQARDVMIEIRAHQARRTPLFKLLGTPRIILSPTATRAYKAAIPQD